ncbi:hypothetical protein LT493_01515 [Streptomyces tricolor]|nr:hypothetical protein [Streptomyces tricolor]
MIRHLVADVPAPRPGPDRRRLLRCREPGRRGQPQRRPHGRAARRTARPRPAPPSTGCAPPTRSGHHRGPTIAAGEVTS